MEKRSGTKRKAEPSKDLQPAKKEKVKKKSSSQPQPPKEKRKKPSLSKKPKLESPKKREKDDLEPPKVQKKVPAPAQKSAKQSVVKKAAKVGKENPSKSPKKKNSNKSDKLQSADHVVNTPLKALNNKKETPLCPPEPPKCFSFKVEDCQMIVTSEGRKTYCCDICQGEYKRIFSLKRHYLRFHLNYLYLSEQDIKNCGLVTPDKTAIDSNILAQQASIASSKISSAKDGENRVDFPKLFRCHMCGTLVDTKALLVEHLSGHKPSITTETTKVDQESQKDTEIETFICRRCNKSFTARKLYRAHQRNVKCGRKPQQVPSFPSEPVIKLAAVPARCAISTIQASKTKWRALAAGMDVEESLKLGNASSTFRYACTICLKMFVTYTNMCRHRRLAHGIHQRYPDICAKLLGDPSTALHDHADTSPKPSDEEEIEDTSSFLVYDKIEANVKENIMSYLDGITLPSETPEADDLKVKLISWDNYTVTESNGVGRQRFLESVFKLDIPVQIALQKGLNQLEANSAEEKQEEAGFHGALHLIAKSQLRCEQVQSYEREGDVFSGEWTRLRRFLCGTCGQKFESLPELEWHQQDVHPRVFCSYLMIEGEEIPPEISRQFETKEKTVPGDDMTQTAVKMLENVDAQYKCTKCAEAVAPGAGLHAHMLECAGDLTWQLEQQNQSRKRRSAKKKRPQGRHGMRRNHSQTPVKTAANTGTRSQQKAAKRHSYDLASRVQVTRRFLHFHEQKSKEQKPPLDIVKKDSSSSDISCSAQTPLSASRNTRSSIPIEETDPGPIQATSALTLNPHNPGLTNLGIFTCPTCGKQYMYSFPYQKHRSKCSVKCVSPPKKSKKNAMPTLSPAMAASPNPRPQSAKGMDDQDPLPPLLQPETPTTILVPENEDSVQSKPKSKGSTLSVKKVKKTVNKKHPNAENQTGASETTVSEEEALASLEPEGEPEETGERLRTRSARRGISYTSYEHTELDPSFLAALSETQRDHVTEQRCPFCLKQYTYKSNFKKHLLEGCMTLSTGVQKRSSTEEEPEASDLGVKKAKMEGRKSIPRTKSPSEDVASEMKGSCVICFAEFRDEKEFLLHRLAHCLAAGSRDLKSRLTGLVDDQGKKNDWVGWEEKKWEVFLKALKRANWDRLAKELVQDIDCDRLIQEIVCLEKEDNVRESELGTEKDSLVASIVQPFIQDIMKKEMALWSQRSSTVAEPPVSAAVNAPESISEPQSCPDRLVIEEDRGDGLSMDANSDAEEKVACPDDVRPVKFKQSDSQEFSAEIGATGSSNALERRLCPEEERKASDKCTLDSSLTLSVVSPSQSTPPLLNHDSSANSFVCAGNALSA